KTHAAQDSEDFAGAAFGVACVHARCLCLRSNRDLEGGRRGTEKLRRILRSDVGDEIAKTIDLQDYSLQRPFIHRLGTGRAKANIVGDLVAKAIGLDPLGEISGDWGKDIARVEGVAAGLQEIMLGGDMA